MDNYENIYMDLYKSTGIELMNLREGGSRGRHTEITRKRMSIAQKIKPVTQKMLEARKSNIGRKASVETKLKQSLAKKGKVSPKKGVPVSKEIVQAMTNRSCKFIYIIKNKEGVLFETNNLNGFCKERNMHAPLLGNTWRGVDYGGANITQHRGYKIISREPLSK